MYSYGPPQMAGKKQDDQHEHTFSSYVRIRDVALKTCQRRWIIGRSGERGSGISVLVARHDDDDDYSQEVMESRLLRLYFTVWLFLESFLHSYIISSIPIENIVFKKIYLTTNKYYGSSSKWTWECNIMVEGFRFMPLGLVRLRTFRLSTWVRCNLDAGSNACAHRAYMSLRDVTIAWDDETGDKVRVTSGTGSVRRILGISKKVRELKLDTERGGSTFGARWGETNLCAMGAARDSGQMKKPAWKDCVSLSLCRNL